MTLIRSPRRPRKTNRWPLLRIALQRLLHQQRQAGKALAHVDMARRQPDPYAARNRDHSPVLVFDEAGGEPNRSTTSRMRARARASISASIRITRLPDSSISTQRFARKNGRRRQRPDPAPVPHEVGPRATTPPQAGRSGLDHAHPTVTSGSNGRSMTDRHRADGRRRRRWRLSPAPPSRSPPSGLSASADGGRHPEPDQSDGRSRGYPHCLLRGHHTTPQNNDLTPSPQGGSRRRNTGRRRKRALTLLSLVSVPRSRVSQTCCNR